MTPTDDDVIARLRASLKATADRTPISAARPITLTAAPTQAHGRAVVTVVSAAAAVAAIAGVTAAVVGTHGTQSTRIVHPATFGPGVSVASSGSAIATPSSTPTPVASVGAGSAAPVGSPGSCVPENYYVTASPAELTGLTYLLPATPAGYTLYGAWGTISRNLCADSVTWYVEYDPVGGTPGSGSGSIQMTVTKAGDQAVGHASATPIAATPVMIGSVEGSVFEKDPSYALVAWARAGAQIALAGPASNGDVEPLVQLANSVVLLNPSDPRIVAPADCQVPPGSVCGSDSATPTPTASPNPSAGGRVARAPGVDGSVLFGGAVPTPTPTAR